MFGKVCTGAVKGMDGVLVTAEADVSNGLPSFEMVGYLGSEVREARERVRNAIKNSGIELRPCRITVNLSPADLRKQGNYFDLPIALAILQASGFISHNQTENKVFIGELGLDGSIRPVKGVFALLSSEELAGRKAFIPYENMKEAAAIPGADFCPVRSLKDIVEYLHHPEMAVKYEEFTVTETAAKEELLDYEQLKGQEILKRASVIAASGMHNIIYIGQPGTGKSMAARRITTIMPELTIEEKIEITRIYSLCGLLQTEAGIINKRPYRAPHHTISKYALAGGGRFPKPGEISLAHNGVLFLDELPEFKRETLEILRQPMEEGRIVLNRTSQNYVFPARFMMAAAMNLCPCGFYPDRNRCKCTSGDIRRYRNRISGPLLDRIDICVETQNVQYKELSGRKSLNSAQMKEQVEEAAKRQRLRYKNEGILFNSQLTGAQIEKYCRLGRSESKLFEEIFERIMLSMRGKDRMLRVARTIADLDGSEEIKDYHLSEAAGYRIVDRNYWNV